MHSTYPLNRSESAFARLRCGISWMLRYLRFLVAQLEALVRSLFSFQLDFPPSTIGLRSGYLSIRHRILCALAGLVFFFPAESAEVAAEIQDLESIRQAVRSFFAAQVPSTRGERSITVTNVDERLRLRACEQSLVAFFPPGSRAGQNRTVGISCAGPKRWTIYVSVRVRYL